MLARNQYRATALGKCAKRCAVVHEPRGTRSLVTHNLPPSHRRTQSPPGFFVRIPPESRADAAEQLVFAKRFRKITSDTRI